MKVIIYHHIQPDYKKRMALIRKHALYWSQENVAIPMSLVPLA